MRDIAADLAGWLNAGRRFAMASVVNVTGSAPRPPGTAMAVDAEGVAVGGVSGGCVEGAVYDLCRTVLDTGIATTQTFGYSADDAFAVGLTCGGTVTVFVTVVAANDTAAHAAVAALGQATPIAVARVIDGPKAGTTLAVEPGTVSGSLGEASLDEACVDYCRTALAAGAFDRFRLGDNEIVVETYPSPPRLLVFGAVDFAAAVVTAGRFLGYHVTVCDARSVFATSRRFPDADEVVVEWPHRYLDNTTVDERTAMCVLTHDPKFDIPLLSRALRLELGYVGAMGSRRTHRDRADRLLAEGLSQQELSRLHSPIGLDLGGNTPQETALSIMSEIIACRNGAEGRPLSATDEPIHKHPAIWLRSRNGSHVSQRRSDAWRPAARHAQRRAARGRYSYRPRLPVLLHQRRSPRPGPGRCRR